MTKTRTLIVSKASQTITFDPLPDRTIIQPPPLSISATASSELPLIFTVLGGSAGFRIGGKSGTLTNTIQATAMGTATLEITGLGGVTIVAAQPGNQNYLSAPSVVRIFEVTKAMPSISWVRPSAIVYGTALSGTELNAAVNGVPGTFAYSPALGTLLGAGTNTLTVTFTPTDSANYDNATATQSWVVSKASQTITFAALPNKTYRDAPIVLLATASSGLAVSFSVLSGPATVSGSTLTLTGAGSVTVRAAQAGNTNYLAATSIDRSFTVTKDTPVITWATPAAIVYGTVLSAAQLSATANVPGTFRCIPAVGAVLNAGTSTLSVSFTPTDARNYNSTSASVPIIVQKAPLTITAVNKTTIYGAALPGLTATYQGFVNGETAADLDTPVELTTTATARRRRIQAIMRPVRSRSDLPTAKSATSWISPIGSQRTASWKGTIRFA